MKLVRALLKRETSLAWGRGGGALVALGFYAGITTLLPLAVGPEPARLSAVAPGIAWMALALASLLNLDRLFERDFEDGALDILLTSPMPLEITCAVKCLGQWLATGAPLGFAAPVAGAPRCCLGQVQWRRGHGQRPRLRARRPMRRAPHRTSRSALRH